MQAVLGVTYQTMLGAIRSRLFLSELLLVLAISLGAPAILRGDGTLAGHINLTVRYTLMANWIVLGAGVLWSSGADMAADIASRRLHLVLTKPIGGVRLLLGRWLGQLALHAVLALLAVAITAATVQHTSHAYADSPENRQLLQAHRVARTLPTLTPEQVRDAFDRARAGGQLAPDITFDQAAPMLRSAMLAQRATANTGHERAWRFNAGDLQQALAHARGDTAWLRFRFTTSAFDRRPIQGIWTLTAGERKLQTPVVGIQDGRHVVPLPIRDLAAALSPLPADAQVRAAFSNGADEVSCTVMFDTTAPVEILLPCSTLGPNMLRGCLIMVASLGSLCALGLLCGVLFSGPVAAVAGLGILAAVSLSVGTDAGENWSADLTDRGTAVRALAQATDSMMAGLRRIAQPAIQHQAVSRITDGELLSARSLAESCLPLLGLYSLPLLIGAGLILNRRQLGAT